MIDTKMNTLAPVEKTVDLLEVLITLLKRKKLIIFFPISVGIIASVIVFTLPNIYKASTNILPPQQAQSSAAGLLAQLGGVGSIASGITGIKNPNDLFIGMLRSRTIADKLISQFGLIKQYDLSSIEKTRNELADRTSLLAGKDGIITISVEDENPKHAANIANAYVKELFSLTNVLAITEAGQRRIFFERELEKTKNNLANAEFGLKRSLSARGVISVDTESRVIVETISRMRAQIAAKEIQLGSLSSFVTPEQQDYKRLQQELSSLHSELSKLENGNGNADKETGMNNSRLEGLENIKALRDLKYQQLLYELLAKQYEAARLDEAKQAPLVQVLDSAIAPERKAKPKRLFIVLTAYLISLSAVIVFVIASEAKRQAMLVPERAYQWQRLKVLMSFR